MATGPHVEEEEGAGGAGGGDGSGVAHAPPARGSLRAPVPPSAAGRAWSQGEIVGLWREAAMNALRRGLAGGGTGGGAPAEEEAQLAIRWGDVQAAVATTAAARRAVHGW